MLEYLPGIVDFFALTMHKIVFRSFNISSACFIFVAEFGVTPSLLKEPYNFEPSCCLQILGVHCKLLASKPYMQPTTNKQQISFER